jgi:hypothetical protein
MCPDGFNQSLWNSCYKNALDNRQWAQKQITEYPDYLTNPIFTDISRKQISHFIEIPPETTAKLEYEFLLMMARHQPAVKSITDNLRIDLSK